MPRVRIWPQGAHHHDGHAGLVGCAGLMSAFPQTQADDAVVVRGQAGLCSQDLAVMCGA